MTAARSGRQSPTRIGFAWQEPEQQLITRRQAPAGQHRAYLSAVPRRVYFAETRPEPQRSPEAPPATAGGAATQRTRALRRTETQRAACSGGKMSVSNKPRQGSQLWLNASSRRKAPGQDCFRRTLRPRSRPPPSRPKPGPARIPAVSGGGYEEEVPRSTGHRRR